ncbi:hypothetical protein CANCADRAFT_19803, partial [Tortispora caseinolytica NRRL Y-17796]
MEFSKSLNRSFPDYMKFVSLGNDEFQSVRKPLKPVVAAGAYGGHLVGQSMMVASETVEGPLLCVAHYCTFIRPGPVDIPIRYRVERINSGRNFAIRAVYAYGVEKLGELSKIVF